VVPRLLGNVAFDLVDLREPDGEHSIAALPGEIPERFILLLDPERRSTLQLLYHLGRLARTGQASQQVHMVGDSTYNQGLATQMIKNAAKIAVELSPELILSEEWPSLFRREDGVDEDFGQGLRHRTSMRRV